MGNNNQNVEKITSKDALNLIFATANAPGLEHQRINPEKVSELSRTLGRWKQRPSILTTPRGVVLKGVDYLAAMAEAGKAEAEVVIDRSGSTGKREARQPSSLTEQLRRHGIQEAPFKLAVWRAVREGMEVNPGEETPRQLVDRLSEDSFAQAFEALHAPYEMISSKGVGKATRVRSKLAFAAFLLAYHANPKRVTQLYTDFLAGKVKEGSPVEKLLNAVRHDNINTGSGRRPFMLKAAILLKAQLAGDTVERAVADEVEGQKVVEIFRRQSGNA